MEITAALDRAYQHSRKARLELKSIEVGDTVAGGPLLELDLGHALVALDAVDLALKRAYRHAAMIEAPS